MRFVFFLVSSSLLIGLVLLIRTVFRKKLASGVIYALWLIPLLRLMVPFAGWELPVFGEIADFLNSPYAFVTEWIEGEKSLDAYDEDVFVHSGIVAEETGEEAGIKIYDAVAPESNETAEVFKDSLTPVRETQEDAALGNPAWIAIGICFTGSLLLGFYVLVKNRKLNRSTGKMETIDEVDGIKVCVGNNVKVPCLVGLKNPRIVVSKEVFENPELYQCVLQHELAHFQQKDHIWTAVRILICIIYWWHPLMWIAASAVQEDAELSCDARVLKGKTVEARKAYGYALLRMLENAQSENCRFYAATSMSGDKKSIKRRIKEISNGTSTKRNVLLPITLLLAAIFVLGCAVPTVKSQIKMTEWENGGSEDNVYSEGEYKYALQNNIQSRLLYYEIYEYGQLTERNILAYGNFEEHNRKFRIRQEYGESEAERNLVLKTEGAETTLPMPDLKQERKRVESISWNVQEQVVVEPGDDLVLLAEFQLKDGEEAITDSCSELSKYTEEELAEVLKDNYVTTLIRLTLSEQSERQLYEAHVQRELSKERELIEKVTDAAEAVENGVTSSEALTAAWAEAFVNRNVYTIGALTSEECFQKLIENGLVGEYEEGEYYFGWSSPWPMFGNQLYEIVECSDSGAKIRYYASFSTPHVYVWDETLEFENVNGEFQVVNESNHFYEAIYTAEEFHQAYPNGTVAGTMMDYSTNGLGEFLNENALENPENSEYQPLFSPETAAANLLNLSMDEELVSYSVEDNGETATVEIYFLREGGKNDMVEVTMWQPYGEKGIWIPKNYKGIMDVSEHNRELEQQQAQLEKYEEQIEKLNSQIVLLQQADNLPEDKLQEELSMKQREIELLREKIEEAKEIMDIQENK